MKKLSLLFQKLWIRGLLVVFIALIVALIANLFENRGVLGLPKEARGIYALQTGVSKTESITVSGESLPSYIDKMYYIVEHDGRLEASLTVDGVSIQDHVPLYLEQSFIPIERHHVSEVTLTVSVPPETEGTGRALIKEIGISNQFQWNPYLFCFWFLLVLCLGGIWAFANVFANRAEFFFLWAAIILGSLFIILLPTNKTSWDEETHFYRSLCISEYPNGLSVSQAVTDEFRVTEANWPYNQPDGAEEQAAFSEAQSRLDRETASSYSQARSLAKFATTGYLAESLFLKIGRAISMPFALLYRFGRLGNLLQYILLMFFAIRVIPFGKRILSVIALMPTSLFLAATYSYDASIIGFISLGMAMIIREILTTEQTIQWKNYLIAGASLVLGILPKAIYAPLVLLALFIPREKFQNNRQRYIMKGAVVLTFVFLIASFVLPMMTGASAVTDVRGGDTNGSLQMQLILQAPGAYTKLLFKSVLTTLPSYLAGYNVYGQLGHLTGSPFRILFPLLIVGVFLTDAPERDIRIPRITRIVAIILLAISIAMIWTALYISYTPVGADYIAGVQPRYYLPLMVPILFALFFNWLKIRSHQRIYTSVVVSLSSVVVLVTLFLSIYIPYCR